VEANNWVTFAVVGIALLAVGIVMSTMVGQERIPGSLEYRRTSPFAFQGLVLATIGGLVIIATIAGNIGYRLGRRFNHRYLGLGEIRIRAKGNN
jgi:hypothetical protein